MSPIRLFISSVQKEFAAERAVLKEYLQADALMKRFFEPFLFEETPAADRRVDDLYLQEVEQCDVYLGLFGNEYGFEDRKGISPTEYEFRLATKLGKQRLIYVKGVDDKKKHPKMRALIQLAGSELIRRRFTDAPSLLPAVYASLVAYLEEHRLILKGPFDGALCRGAMLKDLNSAGMKAFIREARASRGFPLKESAPIGSVPYNPLLAEPLYLTQYIERMGTGTGDMIRRCREAGMKEPQFHISDGFVLTIWRQKRDLKDPMSGEMSGEKLDGLELRTLDLMREKPDITIPQIAKKLKRTERTVERLINKLKTDEVIGRIGPRKGGHWEVLK